MAPSTKTGWVAWAKCPARDVIIEDLRPGGHLYNRDYITAQEIFPWYKQFPAFDTVVFDQFKDRLSDHRKAASIDSFLAEQQQVYFKNDQALYPRQRHNARGQKIFDLDAAKLLLREDIKAGEHLKFERPAMLKGKRLEYKEWGNKQFSDRIRQEIKRNKYFHYLDIKRKLKLHGKTKKEINQILKTTGGKMEEVDKFLIEDDVRRKLKLKGKTKKDIDKIFQEWGGNMEEIDKILDEMDVDSGTCDDF
jgi:hypothetical protein